MKLTVDRSKLLEAINVAARALPSRTSNHILECIHLSVVGGERVEVVAYDQTTGIRYTIPSENAQIGEGGAVVVKGKMLQEIVKVLDGAQVELETKDSTLHIRSNKAKYKLNMQDANMYPKLPVVDSTRQIEVVAEDFKLGVAQVAFAASKNESRPELTGVYVQSTEDGLIMTATDAILLARTTVPCKIESNDMNVSVNIPASSMSDLAAMLPSNKTEVKIAESVSHLSVSWDNIELNARLLQGQYPNVVTLLTNVRGFATQKIVVSPSIMSKSLSRVLVLSKDDDNSRIVLDATKPDSSSENGQVRLVGVSTEYGRVEEIFDSASSNATENLQVACNGKFLQKAMDTLTKQETVSISLPKEKAKPFLIEGEHTVYLISVVVTRGDV